MLHEIKHILQTEDGIWRRWFSDDDFDLFLWLDRTNHGIQRFELTYGKNWKEQSLVWDSREGYALRRVDSGESLHHLHYKMSPTVDREVSEGLDKAILERFLQASVHLEPEFVEFVAGKLREYLDNWQA